MRTFGTLGLFALIAGASHGLLACDPYNPELGANPFKCGPSKACPDGYVCNDDEICELPGGGVEQCDDDSVIEPNETISSAYGTPVASSRADVSYASLAICPADDIDMFQVTVDSNGLNLSITMTYDVDGGTLALRLLNEPGVLIKAGTDDGGTVGLAVTNLAFGNYYVEVTAADGDTNNYRLEIDSTL